MPSALVTTVVVMEEPSRRALTSTPSMTGSCAEVTLPVSATTPCACAAFASGRVADTAVKVNEANNVQIDRMRRTIIPPFGSVNAASKRNGSPAPQQYLLRRCCLQGKRRPGGLLRRSAPVGFPEPRRRRRHVEIVSGAARNGVGHRVHHRGDRRRGAGLADAFDAERIEIGRASCR